MEVQLYQANLVSIADRLYTIVEDSYIYIWVVTSTSCPLTSKKHPTNSYMNLVHRGEPVNLMVNPALPTTT